MNDRDIVGMFLDRNEDAVAESKKRYGDYCVYIANNVLHDSEDAKECLNDALFAAWRSIPPNKPENLKTYLGKLIHETAIDRWRKNNRQKRIRSDIVGPLEEIEEIVKGADIDEKLEEAELSREISRYLLSVDETKRKVFIRRYWYYDSVENICQRYGLGKSKVLMTLKRTRDGLARHLKKEGFFT